MRVGTIVPVHAPAPYLGEALEAVLAQRPAPHEVVVVDDGSDEPVQLDSSHASRCRLVRREARGGAPAARNTGLARLETELVALADADDAWEEGKLGAQLEAFERHPGAAVCFGRATVIGPDGAPTGERWREPRAGLLEADAVGALLYESNVIPTSSAVIRRAQLEAAGGFSGPPPAEDLALWLVLAERGARFVYEPRAAIRYRRHPGGLTADVEALAEASLAVHRAHAGLVDEETRRRVESRDLAALARGRVRRRRYAEARGDLRRAGSLWPLEARERALLLLLGVPGLRALLGRRDPYR